MQDVMRWLAAVPTLAGLGLALGLSPALYGATADILARGREVRARMTMLLSGLVTGATLLVVVLHGVNPANLVSGARSRGDAVVENRLVDLIVAVVLLLAACAMLLWIRRVPHPPPRRRESPDQNTRPTGLFVVGFSSAIVGFTTLPIMYLTGRTVVGLSADPLLWLVAYGIFVVALIAPFVLLATIWSRFPRATRKVTGLYSRVLQWDFRRVSAAMMVLCALILFLYVPFGHHAR